MKQRSLEAHSTACREGTNHVGLWHYGVHQSRNRERPRGHRRRDDQPSHPQAGTALRFVSSSSDPALLRRWLRGPRSSFRRGTTPRAGRLLRRGLAVVPWFRRRSAQRPSALALALCFGQPSPLKWAVEATKPQWIVDRTVIVKAPTDPFFCQIYGPFLIWHTAQIASLPRLLLCYIHSWHAGEAASANSRAGTGAFELAQATGSKAGAAPEVRAATAPEQKSGRANAQRTEGLTPLDRAAHVNHSSGH